MFVSDGGLRPFGEDSVLHEHFDRADADLEHVLGYAAQEFGLMCPIRTVLDGVAVHRFTLSEEGFLGFGQAVEDVRMSGEVVLEYPQELPLVESFVEFHVLRELRTDFQFHAGDRFKGKVFGIEELFALLYGVRDLVVDADELTFVQRVPLFPDVPGFERSAASAEFCVFLFGRWKFFVYSGNGVGEVEAHVETPQLVDVEVLLDELPDSGFSKYPEGAGIGAHVVARSDRSSGIAFVVGEEGMVFADERDFVEVSLDEGFLGHVVSEFPDVGIVAVHSFEEVFFEESRESFKFVQSEMEDVVHTDGKGLIGAHVWGKR